MSELASRDQLRFAFARWAFVTVPAILLLGVLSASLSQSGSENVWYAALRKPAITPPDWLFPVAWTTLYILMGLAFAMILNARGARFRGPAILFFILQLIVNFCWSPVFFGAHLVIAAMAVLAAMFVLSLIATVLFGRIRVIAAWLMVPYLLWIVFAGILLWQVHALNPDAHMLAPGRATTQIAL